MDENGPDDGYNEIDRQFDELDELVEIAKTGARDDPKAYLKYYTSVEMVNLIMEEIPGIRYKNAGLFFIKYALISL